MTTGRLLVLYASLAVCTVANGAVIELRNGDRLTGHIVSRDSDSVLLKTDGLGKIDIPRSKIAKITEDKLRGTEPAASLPPVINIAGARPSTAPRPDSKPAPKKEVHAPAQQTEVVATVEEPSATPQVKKPLKGRKYISHSLMAFLKRINFLHKWKSNLRIGYNLYSGETDSYSNTVNFLTSRLWTKSEFRFEFKQEYATSTDRDGKETVSRDKLRVNGRYRYNSEDKKIFFQSESQYGYARISGIDQDYLQSFGCGWRIMQSEIWYFCLVPSISGQYQVIESEQQGVSLAPTLYEEAEYKWTDTLLIHNEAYAIIPANGDGQPTYHFSIMLQNKLVGNLSLNIEYVFDFDGSVKESKDAAQQSLRASFGIDF